MALNDAAADAAAAAVKTALDALPKDATLGTEAQKVVFRAIAKMIRDNAVVTIPSAAIVTTGSAATQTGPASPVPLTVS